MRNYWKSFITIIAIAAAIGSIVLLLASCKTAPHKEPIIILVPEKITYSDK